MIVRVREPGSTGLMVLGAVLQHDDVIVVVPAPRPSLEWILRAARSVAREALEPAIGRRLGIEALAETELTEAMREWVREGGPVFTPREGGIQLAGRRSRPMDDYDHLVNDGRDLVAWLDQQRRERHVSR